MLLKPLENAAKVIIVSGLSRSGKDTLADLTGLPIVKFAAPMKRAFETFMSLPVGFLDSEARNNRVVDIVTGITMAYTYLDVMVNAFKVWKSIHPHGLALGAVEASWQGLKAFVLSDLRAPNEAALVLNRFPQEDILNIVITGRGTELESDIHLAANGAKFINKVILNNDSTYDNYIDLITTVALPAITNFIK